MNVDSYQDPTTEEGLKALGEVEKISGNRISDVRTVLVVLSAKAMAFDRDALKQKIEMAYPHCQVFFLNTLGKPIGAALKKVDLLIDFTGPGQRQGLLLGWRLRKRAQFAVGRNAGLFRKRLYDRVYDEAIPGLELPRDLFEKERIVQKQVLALAGVPMVPTADLTPDLAHTIAHTIDERRVG